MPAITTIQLRKGTAAAWTAANPVLALGEPGLETDTGKMKYGDGVTAWTSLTSAVLPPSGTYAQAATTAGGAAARVNEHYLSALDPRVGMAADGTDCTAAFLAAITTYLPNGGTFFFPPGTWTFLGEILLPNDGASPPQQKSLRLTGAGFSANGRGSGSFGPNGGSILDLRYSIGTDGTQPKIDTRGYGTLEIDHLTIKDGGTSTTPFLRTTNTTLYVHHVGFVGNSSKNGVTCDQDAIILGGSNGAINDGTNDSGFQGYGTVIEQCHFMRIRRAVYGRANCNSSIVRDNTVWQSCGSNLATGAAIEFDGSGVSATGNVIMGNLIEMPGYPYGIKFVNVCPVNSVIGNNFYDDTAFTLAFIRFEAAAQFNLVVCGYSGDVRTHVSDASTPTTQTVVTSHAAKASTYVNLAVGAGTFTTATGSALGFCGSAAVGQQHPDQAGGIGTALKNYGLLTNSPVLDFHVVKAISPGSGAYNVDASQGDIVRVTLTANAGVATIVNPLDKQRLIIEFAQNATGGWTYSWPTNCRFAANTAPVASTAANTVDKVTFEYRSATSIWEEISRAVGVPTT